MCAQRSLKEAGPCKTDVSSRGRKNGFDEQMSGPYDKVKDLEPAMHQTPTHLFTNAVCSVTGVVVSAEQRERERRHEIGCIRYGKFSNPLVSSL